MPHSWIRIPNGASPAVRRCMESRDDTSRVGFEACVGEIAEKHGGEIERFDYETNGRWARIYLEWPNHDSKRDIVYELQGEDVVDVLSREEVDLLGS